MLWFLDFDDTLALGPITWAFQNTFPTFIRTHNLPFDKERFTRLALEAQRRAYEVNEMEVLEAFFLDMGWSLSLRQTLVDDIFNGYSPTLFDDSAPFLEQVTQRGDSVYLVSNNNHAPHLLESLGIRGCFTGVYTPRLCGVERGKPHSDMWAVIAPQVSISAGQAALIGDDPWSDGAFAERCGLPCWLVDRLGRFNDLREEIPYRWVNSLAEVLQTV